MPRFTAYQSKQPSVRRPLEKLAEMRRDIIAREVVRPPRFYRLTKEQFVRRAMEDLGILEADDE